MTNYQLGACSVTELAEGRQVSYRIEGWDKAQVQEALDTIIERYPPQGYGTMWSGPTAGGAGLWLATATRAASCD